MKVINIGFQELLEENVKELTSGMEWLKNRTLKLAGSLDEVKEFIDKAINAGKCALDLETTGLNVRTRSVLDPKTGQTNKEPIERIVGISLSYDPLVGLYIPVRHREDPELNLPELQVYDEIRRLCANCVTIYHHAKFDLANLANVGIYVDDFNKFEDTLIQARLFDAGSKDNKLKHLSERILNQPMIEFDEICKDKKFDLVSPKVGYIYAGSDAVCTLDLNNFFLSQQILKDQKSIYNLEKRLVFAVMEMESNLIKINVPFLKTLKEKASNRIKEIEAEIHKMAGRVFNIGSTQQLGKLLFDEFKYTYPDKTAKTKSGQYSTENATLEKIQDLYPIVKKIMEFRGLQKCLTTYIENLLANHDENDCVKLGFNQSGTDTGRFSSPGGSGIDIDGYSGVNVQSIPKKPDENNPDIDMRKSFVARIGYKIVAADYENEEMKVATNLSGEPAWINAAKNGVDFHRATGALITGKDIKDVTDDDRRIAKTVDFLAMYGGGARNLAQQAKISEIEARRVLNSFNAGVPKLRSWMATEIARSRKSKFVKTPFGRTRPLHRYYNSGDKALEAHGDRCVPNTQIQGSSADIMKTVMIRIHIWIHKYNLQDDIRVLITMHDELVFEIKEDKLDIYIPRIAKIMMLEDILQGLLKWPIPLTVEVKVGDSWRVKEKYFDTHPEAKVAINELPLDFSYADTSALPNRYSIALGETKIPDLGALKTDSTSVDTLLTEVIPVETPSVSPTDQMSTSSSNPVQTVPETIPEIAVPKEKFTIENDIFIYTINKRSRGTVRWMNDILSFLLNEEKKNAYTGQKKILRIKDEDGNSLLVSEFKVPIEPFLFLARFFEL